MTEKGRNSVVPGTSSNSIKMDLLMFKDDILKDFRTIQISLDEKYAKADEYLSEKINKFDLKIKSFEKKIFELSNLIVTDNSIREKVEKLCQSEDEIRDTIFKRRAIFNEFEKKTKDDINRINNILTESVLYPGIIGNSCKFSSFHDFMDSVIQDLAQLNLFKDKSGLDLGPFKRKIDTTLETLKLQINNFCSKNFVKTTISQSEERIQSLLKVYDDRLQDTRVENSHYSLGLIKKTEEIAKQMEKLRKYQNQLLDAKHNEEIFNTYNNEIYSIKNRINTINEVLKELLSFHPSSKISFGNGNEVIKKSTKIVSGVKQYIKGNLNANELSTMKKFTYEKSNSKSDNNINSPSPNTSPFHSPDSMKFNNNNLNNHHNVDKKRNSLNVNNTNLLFLNSYTNKKDNNVVHDKRKNFVSQKSLNMSNKLDLINKKFSEETNKINKTEKNEKNEKKENKKKPFIKRNTCTSINTNNLQNNKFYNENINDIRLSFQVNENHIIIENKKESIEEDDNNLTLSKKDSNQVNEFNDSFVKDDINQNTNKNNNMSESSQNQSKSNNQSIIKEEDENISDNSTKNLKICNSERKKTEKKLENKTDGNKNEKENNIKEKAEEKKEDENKKETETEKENHDILKDNEYENKFEKTNGNKTEDQIENDNDNENKSSNNNVVDEKKKGINDVLNNISKSPLKVEKALKSNSIKYNIKPESFKEEPNTMSSDHNITSINNKDKIDPYNSENSNLKLVAIKKRNRSNNLDNNEDISTTYKESNNINNKISSQSFKELNNSLKNNFNDLSNKVKLQHDNIKKIINSMNNAGSKTGRDGNINKSLKNNSSFPKTTQSQLHVTLYPKKDTIKAPHSPVTKRIEKSLINSLIEYNVSKNPLIYKYISNNNLNNYNNINIIPIKNENKTFTSFPKIKSDFSERKIIQKNNFNEKKNINIIAQAINDAKYPKQQITKNPSYDKKPKKVLLINPDNIPPNILIIRKKNKSSNKNRSMQNERENKTAKIESLKDQIRLPFKINSNDDDILKFNQNVFEIKKE